MATPTDNVRLLDQKLEDRYLRSLLEYSELINLSIDQITDEDFSTSVKARLFKAIQFYWQEINEIPTKDMMLATLGELYKGDISADKLLLTALYKNDPPPYNWILTRLDSHVRAIKLRKAMFRANDLLSNRDYDAAERALVDTIRNGGLDQSLGGNDLFLTREQLQKLAYTEDSRISGTGILELDKLIGGLTRKELFILLAPLNVGKSWFVVHTAINALIRKQYVLYITLEMSRERVLQRLLQNIAAVAMPKSGDETSRTETVWKADSWEMIESEVPTLLDTDHVAKSLTYLQRFQGNLFVKEFPSGDATISDIEQQVARFNVDRGRPPDLVIVDGLMDMKRPVAVSDSAQRFSLTDTAKKLRRMAQHHDCSVLVTHQANREGVNAELVGVHHSGESIGVMQVADVGVSLQQTAKEQKSSVARLYVMRSRSSAKYGEVKIYQNLALGQFYLGGELVVAKEEEDGKDGAEPQDGPRPRRKRRALGDPPADVVPIQRPRPKR